MTKPRTALRARLLEAMRACPAGKELSAYAAELHVNRDSIEKAATMCRAYGQVICMRAGRPFLWTSAEHSEALAAGCAAEVERQKAQLAESGILDARLARARERRRENQKDRRKTRKRKALVSQATGEQSKARYRWPDEAEWSPPVALRCVWDLAR